MMKKGFLAVASVSLLLLVVLTSAYRIDNNERNSKLIEGEVQWLSFEEALEKSKTEQCIKMNSVRL